MSFRKLRLLITTVVVGLLLLALIAAVVFVLVFGARGETPFVGSHSILWITTGSMSPTIEERTYVLIEKVSPSDIKKDDIICFVSDDPSIYGMRNTHRVLEVIGDHEAFKTAGDFTKVEDPVPASADKLIGRYVKSLPVLSVAGRLLSTPVGLFGAGFLFILVMVLVYLPDIRRIFSLANAASTTKEDLVQQKIREEVERLKAAGGIPEPESVSADVELEETLEKKQKEEPEETPEETLEEAAEDAPEQAPDGEGKTDEANNTPNDI